METCQSCRYFMPKSEVKGECRRSAPTLQIYPNGPNFSVFPPMLADEWCGKFKMKEVKQ